MFERFKNLFKSNTSHIKAVVRSVSQLELQKFEYIKLAPGLGLYGITLTGNSITTIGYDLHNGTEWIRTHAYLTPKGKLSFASKNSDNVEILTPKTIRKALNPLLKSLSTYFPYDKASVVRFNQE